MVDILPMLVGWLCEKAGIQRAHAACADIAKALHGWEVVPGTRPFEASHSSMMALPKLFGQGVSKQPGDKDLLNVSQGKAPGGIRRGLRRQWLSDRGRKFNSAVGEKSGCTGRRTSRALRQPK